MNLRLLLGSKVIFLFLFVIWTLYSTLEFRRHLAFYRQQVETEIGEATVKPMQAKEEFVQSFLSQVEMYFVDSAFIRPVEAVLWIFGRESATKYLDFPVTNKRKAEKFLEEYAPEELQSIRRISKAGIIGEFLGGIVFPALLALSLLLDMKKAMRGQCAWLNMKFIHLIKCERCGHQFPSNERCEQCKPLKPEENVAI